MRSVPPGIAALSSAVGSARLRPLGRRGGPARARSGLAPFVVRRATQQRERERERKEGRRPGVLVAEFHVVRFVDRPALIGVAHVVPCSMKSCKIMILVSRPLASVGACRRAWVQFLVVTCKLTLLSTDSGREKREIGSGRGRGRGRGGWGGAEDMERKRGRKIERV